MNEEKSIEGTSTIIWCKLRAKVFMYDHNTKNSMQFAYNIPYIMREWAKILRNSSQYKKKFICESYNMYNVHHTCSFLFLQYFFLRSDSFLLRHIKNLWNSFLIHYKKNRSSYLIFRARKVSVYGTDYYIPLLCDSVELSNQTLLVFLWSIIKPN